MNSFRCCLPAELNELRKHAAQDVSFIRTISFNDRLPLCKTRLGVLKRFQGLRQLLLHKDSGACTQTDIDEYSTVKEFVARRFREFRPGYPHGQALDMSQVSTSRKCMPRLDVIYKSRFWVDSEDDIGVVVPMTAQFPGDSWSPCYTEFIVLWSIRVRSNGIWDLVCAGSETPNTVSGQDYTFSRLGRIRRTGEWTWPTPQREMRTTTA